MAEFLEETSMPDVDRQIDRCDFQNTQFGIFKQTLVDKMDEKDETTFSANINILRDMSSIITRLKKGKLWLRMNSDCVSQMSRKIDEILDEFSKLKEEALTEFTPSTVELPDYDIDDMELFMGKEAMLDSTSPIDPVFYACQLSNKFEMRATALIGASEIMLNEIGDMKKQMMLSIKNQAE